MVNLAKQVTGLCKALSQIQIIHSEGLFHHLEYKNVYEGEGNLMTQKYTFSQTV